MTKKMLRIKFKLFVEKVFWGSFFCDTEEKINNEANIHNYPIRCIQGVKQNSNGWYQTRKLFLSLLKWYITFIWGTVIWIIRTEEKNETEWYIII